MRYILTAAVGTLLVIAALLALPPIGETQTSLISQSAGDRLATVGSIDDPDGASTDPIEATTTVAPTASRQALSPTSTDAAVDSIAEVLGVVEFNLSDELNAPREALVIPEASSKDDAASSDTDDATGDGVNGSLAIDASTDGETESSSEAAPTTTAPTTTTTTTAAPTTTAPATTVAPPVTAAPVSGDGGVIISPRGVVLPIIEPLADGGFRALTPCANETVIYDGTRVTHVDFVIDAGHGGSEPGAVGPTTGVTEKALNLRVAEIVEWYLEEAGYSVLQTRTTDIRLPLRSRAEIANAVQPDAFISIHHNGGATRPQSTPGSELFVDGGNPEARRLGGLMFEEMIDHMSNYQANWVGGWRNGVGTRFNSSGEDLYGIHRFTPGVPSVITEVGYLSNPSEEALYVDNDVQWSHAKAIADALIRWKTTSEVGYGYLDDFVDDSSSGTGGFNGCTDPTL